MAPAEADNAQPEGGVGQRKHQPALGHVLHPGADVGEEVAAPEEAEVGIAKGADDLREAAVSRVGECGRGCGGLFDCQALHPTGEDPSVGVPGFGLRIQLAVRAQIRLPLVSSVSCGLSRHEPAFIDNSGDKRQ